METLSQIALTLTPGLGNNAIRRLLDLFPNEDPFALPPSEIKAAFGRHRTTADAILGKTAFPRAEQELDYCQKNNIRPLFFTDPAYPQRLNRPETADCPALLYVLGNADLNPERSVAIVGTRRATPQGRDNTDHLVRDLVPYRTPIISGLAYGIDTAAHSAALNHGLPTVAVLGHGLDRIYPPENRPLAKRILEAGGALVTEYHSFTAINPRYFPARNRIIAAMADTTVVVEAANKGGALITAAIAASYHRDVFAFPGRLSDTYSQGTLNLIATSRAILIRNADDIAFQQGWSLVGRQTSLDFDTPAVKLSADEQKIVDALRANEHMTLDEIAAATNLPLPKAASLLFNLEMNNTVQTLPGHLYRLPG